MSFFLHIYHNKSILNYFDISKKTNFNNLLEIYYYFAYIETENSSIFSLIFFLLYMVIQLWLLWIIILISPLVPPVLVPLSYSFTGFLLLQKIDPRIVSLVSVWFATLGAILIWKIQSHIIQRLTIYETIPDTGFFSRIARRINYYFRKETKIAQLSLKRERYIETRTGKVATFLFAIFCFLPILPDIIGTRILYKKITFPYFVLAVLIGKSATHIPFIFAGKTLLQLLNI